VPPFPEWRAAGEKKYPRCQSDVRHSAKKLVLVRLLQLDLFFFGANRKKPVTSLERENCDGPIILKTPAGPELSRRPNLETQNRFVILK